ncbi:MAG: hypothetical protein ACRDOI_35590, partial [Trebonia sp.]
MTANGAVASSAVASPRQTTSVHLGRSRSSSEWTSRKGGSRKRPPDGAMMVYPLSYQLYKCEHDLTAAEQ